MGRENSLILTNLIVVRKINFICVQNYDMIDKNYDMIDINMIEIKHLQNLEIFGCI